jgi:NMD protein affecting ribosome stability and mRNA decay
MTRRHSTPTPDTPPGSVTRDRDRVFDDVRHDPYQAKGKYREPTVCSTCRAVFHRGRWAWGEAPAQAHHAVCPACARIRDHLPAGVVTLSGAFFNAHRVELLQLAHNTVERERSGHPLHRIMNVAETAAETVITTCDVHSARRIGEALRNAYDGDLDMRFGEDEYSVRVNWKR